MEGSGLDAREAWNEGAGAYAQFVDSAADYYRLLLKVSHGGEGSLEEWVAFFLAGVAEQSRDAVTRAGKLIYSLREIGNTVVHTIVVFK